MKNFLKSLFVSLLLPITVQAQPMKDWTTTDKQLFVASEIALFIDWRQTLEAQHYPDRYKENNKILGEHPSASRVNKYFAGAMLGNYFVADYLTDYRTGYLASVIAVELVMIGNNRSVGLKIGF
jgi:hypothetical protein